MERERHYSGDGDRNKDRVGCCGRGVVKAKACLHSKYGGLPILNCTGVCLIEGYLTHGNRGTAVGENLQRKESDQPFCSNAILCRVTGSV